MRHSKGSEQPSPGSTVPIAIGSQTLLPRPDAAAAQSHMPTPDAGNIGPQEANKPAGSQPPGCLTSRRPLSSASKDFDGTVGSIWAGDSPVASPAGNQVVSLGQVNQIEGCGIQQQFQEGLDQYQRPFDSLNPPESLEGASTTRSEKIVTRIGGVNIAPFSLSLMEADVGNGDDDGSHGDGTRGGTGSGDVCGGGGVSVGGGGSVSGAVPGAVDDSRSSPHESAAIQTNQQGSPAVDIILPSQQDDEERDYAVCMTRNAKGAPFNSSVSLLSSLPHDSVVCCARYCWNGDFLATGCRQSAQIFDVQTGQRISVFVEGNSNVGPDDGIGSGKFVRGVCFSPDGNCLITGAEDQTLRVWDVRNRTVKYNLCGHEAEIYSVDASANGQFMVSGSGDRTAKLWSLETGNLLSTLGGEFGPTDTVTTVSISPTNHHVATGSLDKVVRLWDVETSRMVQQFEGHRDSVNSVAFSPDGRMLLSGSLDKTLKLWHVGAPSRQGRKIFSGHKDLVLSVAFGPNWQRMISGSKDRTVKVWDARKPSMSLTIEGHTDSVLSVAHNPRAMSFATGSGDCRARTWSISG